MAGREDDSWFLPKRYGYGSGWPIAWQGWVLLGGYVTAIYLCTRLAAWDREVGLPTAIVAGLCATAVLAYVSARKTRGGWRWRWGDMD